MTNIQNELITLARSADYQTTLQGPKSNSKKFGSSQLSLAELDNWRYVELPHVVNSRSPGIYITLDELVLLHDWKMAKGKFRPALPKLIRSNKENGVVEQSKLAFKLLTDYEAKYNNDGGEGSANADSTDVFSFDEYLKIAKSSMVHLAKSFRGVGPATATLIVSLYQFNIKKLNEKLCLPFLCDESFLFLNPTYGKLKYNYNEYFIFYLQKIIDLSGINNKNVHNSSKIFNLNLIEKSLWYLEKNKENKESIKRIHQINTFLSGSIKRERGLKSEDNNTIPVKKRKV